MRNLILVLILLSVSIGYSAPKKCTDISRISKNANESMATMKRRGFGPAIKESYSKLLDNGVDIDPGFFKNIQTGMGIKVKRFNRKTNKKGYTDSLLQHFDKHGHEFSPPMRSKEEYLRESKKFFASYDRNIMTIKSKSGIVKYNPKTKEFAVLGKSGGIETYYIANLADINKASRYGPYKTIEEWIYNEKWRRPVLDKVE